MGICWLDCELARSGRILVNVRKMERLEKREVKKGVGLVPYRCSDTDSMQLSLSVMVRSFYLVR